MNLFFSNCFHSKVKQDQEDTPKEPEELSSTHQKYVPVFGKSLKNTQTTSTEEHQPTEAICRKKKKEEQSQNTLLLEVCDTTEESQHENKVELAKVTFVAIFRLLDLPHFTIPFKLP